MRFCLLLLSCAVVVGCSGARADYEAVCNAEARSGATAGTPESFNRAMSWAATQVKTDEVKRFMGELAGTEAGRKSEALREAARRAGVESCPLADSWERSLRK